jgi:hypothetical protein
MSCGVQSPDRQRRTPTEHTIQRGDIPRYVIVKAAYSHARARAQGTHDTRDRVFRGAWSQYTHCAQHTATGADSELHADALVARETRLRDTLRDRERVPRDARRLRLYTFQYFRKRAPPLRYCTSYYGVVHIIISVRCKKTNCALRRPTINSVWVCRLGLVTRLSAAPGRAEFFRTRRLLSPSTGGLWMRTRRCWQCGAPLVRSQGLRPAAHTTPHAARCTPHAARRTGFCLMGDAETHGATLVLNSPSGLACKDLPGSHRSAA